MHHTFCYISLPLLHDYDMSFPIFGVFFKNANKQNMRARAKSATREEKRFARVTFLVGDDFTRSLKVGTARRLQCTLASHADVRSLVTHSSRSWGRNA